MFAGSNFGTRLEYAEVARSLGTELGRRGIGVVYGGASVGLMAEVANAALAAGGEVIGVIPRALTEKEVAHEHLTEMHITETMHDRKALMLNLSDAFVAIPGGLGTLDELFEVLTWEQLGFHQKPCGLLNVSGYFDRMIEFLDHITRERFMTERHRGLLLVGQRADELLEMFTNYRSDPGEKLGL